MRFTRAFGIALVVMSAMVSIGASPASAVTELEKVVLCKVNEDPCSEANTFPSGTVLDASLVGTGVLLSSLGNIECTGMQAQGKLTSSLAHGEITALSFSGCTFGGASCTLTPEHLNYLVTGTLNSTHTGYEIVISEKPGNGLLQIHITCGSLINCTLGTSSLLGEVSIDEINHDAVGTALQEMTRVGGICPSTDVVHAKVLARCLQAGALVACFPKMEA